MSKDRNPSWWNKDHDSSWDNIKGAFRRDWEQTKHDFGSKSARDLDQSAGDTIQQAAGSGDADFERNEKAFRYGHGAQAQYRGQAWDDKLESSLSSEYPGEWKRDRDYVKSAYGYRAKP